jgi:galactokinase
MTGRGAADELVGRGLDVALVEEKQRLFDTAIDAFARAAHGRPDHAWWVPGRLEVFGKHTDYAGGHSLVCAIPRGFAVLARPRTDGTVRLSDAIRGEAHVIGGPEDAGRDGSDGTRRLPEDERRRAAPPAGGWRNYAEVAVRRLRRNFPGAAIGADIVLASDLPPASGMSSSSALVVGIAAALAATAHLRLRPDWQHALPTAVAEAGYFACIENGMTFGPLAGDAGVGTHGGSEDHVAIVCGRADQLDAWRFVPITPVAQVALPGDWAFVLATSGVAARKTGEAREAYNRLSHDAGALLERWRHSDPAAASLAAALRSSPEAADRLMTLARQPGEDRSGDDRLERRLRHFTAENARVLDALDACGTRDRDRLGRLSDESQRDAEVLLRNQVPETIALARRARELGAFAASSFGAGFGGSVWALVERNEAATFAEAWLADYRARFPERTTATSFAARPGPGIPRIF